MALEPLGQWYCDRCGGVIASADQGWLEWLNDRGKDGTSLVRHDFHIVHLQGYSPKAHSYGCFFYHEEAHGSIGLDHYAGPRGFINMMSLIDEGRHCNEEYSGPFVRDLREWAELMRRLFLPNYESARRYWSQALSDGFFEGKDDYLIYTPEGLQELIEQYEDS